jgi:hypothetical protein
MQAASGASAGAPVTVPDWIVVGCAVLGAVALVVIFLVNSKSLSATRMVLKEIRNTAHEMHRWSEIAQRQTELNNAPLLKVVAVEEAPPEEDRRGMRIDVKNVGFGSAVNVKCVLNDHNDKEYVSPQTELIGNETASFEPPLLIETVKTIRLDYLSQGGSYAHTTQYNMKSGGQTYALHRVR